VPPGANQEKWGYMLPYCLTIFNISALVPKNIRICKIQYPRNNFWDLMQIRPGSAGEFAFFANSGSDL
jgi:hypothetical protein